MYKTRRLNDEEITKINEIYDTDYKVILIQKKKKKWQIILCNCHFSLSYCI